MEFRKILVAVDFSEPSAGAARWVARHFAADDTEIVLVHVVDIPRPPAFLRGKLPPHDELVETTRLGAATRLETLARELPVTRIQTAARAGRASDTVIELAIEHAVDLIVIGSHGRRRGIWSVLGSTAEHVLEHSPVPVLLATNLPDGAPTRILVPTDSSDSNREVLVAARDLAARFNALVIPLHVFDPLYYGRVQLATAPRDGGADREYTMSAEAWLDERVAEAGFDPQRTSPRVAIGSPSYEIMAAAQREQAQFIVMGSRGSGSIGRALLGSVARSVLRGATCPVLVLKADSRPAG
jgi:nucleotide-binding universal stress UspA family protein